MASSPSPNLNKPDLSGTPVFPAFKIDLSRVRSLEVDRSLVAARNMAKLVPSPLKSLVFTGTTAALNNSSVKAVVAPWIFGAIRQPISVPSLKGAPHLAAE